MYVCIVYLHCRIWMWAQRGHTDCGSTVDKHVGFSFLFLSFRFSCWLGNILLVEVEHSIGCIFQLRLPTFFFSVCFYFGSRLRMWILIGIVLIVFTFVYSTLGKWAEHLNVNKKLKPQHHDNGRLRLVHPCGDADDNRMNGFCERNNGQSRKPNHGIPVSRFLIQCYQLSLGLAATKLPRSTSARY